MEPRCLKDLEADLQGWKFILFARVPLSFGTPCMGAPCPTWADVYGAKD